MVASWTRSFSASEISAMLAPSAAAAWGWMSPFLAERSKLSVIDNGGVVMSVKTSRFVRPFPVDRQRL